MGRRITSALSGFDETAWREEGGEWEPRHSMQLKVIICHYAVRLLHIFLSYLSTQRFISETCEH